MEQKPVLIVVVGPTAIGKTALAIEVAKHFNTEILSFDSRQFYQEMSIGTAVPSQEELAQVPHHYVQNLSIQQDYSVGDYERDANRFITEYFTRKNILVMVGGSGLYEKAVTEGLDKFPDVPPHFREQLNHEFKSHGLKPLQEELQQKDPKYFNNVDIQNPHRVIRALEMIRFTEKPFSSFQNQTPKEKPFQTIKIGLTLPREEIYERINHRVDIMMQNGLLQEVENLVPFQDNNALQTVGYRELFSYLKGDISLDFAVAEIKKNSRRYAKRQLTWYRKDEGVHWFSPKEPQKVIAFLSNSIQ